MFILFGTRHAHLYLIELHPQPSEKNSVLAVAQNLMEGKVAFHCIVLHCIELVFYVSSKQRLQQRCESRKSIECERKGEKSTIQIHKDGEGHPKKCAVCCVYVYILYIISSWYIEFAHVKQATSTPKRHTYSHIHSAPNETSSRLCSPLAVRLLFGIHNSHFHIFFLRAIKL